MKQKVANIYAVAVLYMSDIYRKFVSLKFQVRPYSYSDIYVNSTKTSFEIPEITQIVVFISMTDKRTQ